MIVMKNIKTGEIVQLIDDIDYKDSLIKLSELRSKQDGNWYWIEKSLNHVWLR